MDKAVGVSSAEGDGTWDKAAVDILRLWPGTRGCVAVAFTDMVLQGFSGD